MLSHFSHFLLFCDPRDCSLPASSVHGILQARALEWVAISFSKRNYRKKESEVAKSHPTLCNPMDCSLPGSSTHRISQARVLEWVATSFSNNEIKFSLKSESVSHSVVSVLCNLKDCSLPVSSVHGILQSRILDWVGMPSSSGSSEPRRRTQVSCIAGRFLAV